jgi:succinate dehydrogenase / fumarate reductase membrane anchor subunit
MSAKGTSSFIAMRATSVLLLPFVIWFIWSVAAHAGDSYEEMRAWVAEPLTATVFAIFIAISAYHMRIGLNEVIEDYIHTNAKGVLMTINAVVAIGVAALGFYGAWLHAFKG